jgi:Resolvase, N terminal domain
MELLEELCLQAQGGGAPRFRVIMAWSVDRLERSLQDLMAFLSEIHAEGVELCRTSEGAGSNRGQIWTLCTFRSAASGDLGSAQVTARSADHGRAPCWYVGLRHVRFVDSLSV